MAEGLLQALREHEQTLSTGRHGRWSARGRSDLVDETIRALAAKLREGTALVAIGGYGRRELCPSSDIDLMVLHADAESQHAAETAERTFYPLWDAGIDLGHSVRSVDESVSLARERLDVMTAMLEARLVVGSAPLFRELSSRLRAEIGSAPAKFLRTLLEANEERHERYGSCSALLEPNVKESSGGLRDLHSVRWAAEALGTGGNGLVTGRERAALDDAWEFLVRLRSALHFEAGRRSDRVYLELQPGLAEAFGFGATDRLDSADALMRALFEHARQVEHTVGSTFRRSLEMLGEATPPIALAQPPQSPKAALQALAGVVAEDATLAPGALETIADAIPGTVEWSKGLRAAFLRILQAGERGAAALEQLDRAGALARLIPEWEQVRCRPQRDPYHRWSVDVHLLRTAARAASILADPPGEEDPMLAAAARAVPDRNAVVLGALLHDIGKRGEGRHVQVGARVAERILERMNVPEPTRSHVRFLVGDHLLLLDTATRRDLGDENLILDVGARVGDPSRLAMLYVLTVADAEATGPHASSTWRRALLRELVGKVQRALEREESDRIQELGERLERIGRALEGEDPESVARYLDRLPRVFVLTVDAETAADHYPLVSRPLGAGEVRTVSRPGGGPDTYELSVVAPDRPGLLAMIAGALALAGINILSAQAFTTTDGCAIDTFVVEGSFEPVIGEDRWRRMRTELRHAIEGRVSLEHRVREKRRAYPTPPPVTTEVTVQEDASDFFTVVEVSAADRIGLLFDLASTFQELDLDVHLAKVATYGDRVVDVFYVRDLAGRKLSPSAQAALDRAIVDRLGAE